MVARPLQLSDSTSTHSASPLCLMALFVSDGADKELADTLAHRLECSVDMENIRRRSHRQEALAQLEESGAPVQARALAALIERAEHSPRPARYLDALDQSLARVPLALVHHTALHMYEKLAPGSCESISAFDAEHRERLSYFSIPDLSMERFTHWDREALQNEALSSFRIQVLLSCLERITGNRIGTAEQFFKSLKVDRPHIALGIHDALSKEIPSRLQKLDTVLKFLRDPHFRTGRPSSIQAAIDAIAELGSGERAYILQWLMTRGTTKLSSRQRQHIAATALLAALVLETMPASTAYRVAHRTSYELLGLPQDSKPRGLLHELKIEPGKQSTDCPREGKAVFLTLILGSAMASLPDDSRRRFLKLPFHRYRTASSVLRNAACFALYEVLSSDAGRNPQSIQLHLPARESNMEFPLQERAQGRFKNSSGLQDWAALALRELFGLKAKGKSGLARHSAEEKTRSAANRSKPLNSKEGSQNQPHPTRRPPRSITDYGQQVRQHLIDAQHADTNLERNQSIAKFLKNEAALRSAAERKALGAPSIKKAHVQIFNFARDFPFAGKQICSVINALMRHKDQNALQDIGVNATFARTAIKVILLVPALRRHPVLQRIGDQGFEQEKLLAGIHPKYREEARQLLLSAHETPSE